MWFLLWLWLMCNSQHNTHTLTRKSRHHQCGLCCGYGWCVIPDTQHTLIRKSHRGHQCGLCCGYGWCVIPDTHTPTRKSRRGHQCGFCCGCGWCVIPDTQYTLARKHHFSARTLYVAGRLLAALTPHHTH